uniref:Uncharacterized protein n=1 Tax=Magallana gigas TaxID=29159 RepID=K1R5A1_MAGGI
MLWEFSLSKLVNEQKKLREEIYKLNCTLEASQAQKCAIVEGSPIELMGNKEVDVEGLALKSLHNYLWKCFLPSHVPILDTQRQHLTLMLVKPFRLV